MELASISQNLTQVCPPCTTARCLGTFSKSKRLFVANAAAPSPKDTSPSSIVLRRRQRRPSGEVRLKFQVCWTRCQNSSAVDNSPFTERASPRKTHGGGLIPNISLPEDRISGGCDDTSDDGHARSLLARAASGESLRQFVDDQEGGNAHDLSEKSAQLPELREVLAMLREKRSEEAGTEKGRGCSGNVFLVGTGPGDPELLTVKAVRLMQSADLVLYDRLVSADILDLVHAGARLLYVGKTSGYHSRTQEEIHELLLSFAEAGATVVRLKGGDPLVFGRGGEEMDFLQTQGIQVNVIPGITAASGIAAELGIPLTHRGAANSVRFLTGHSRKGGEDPLYVAEQAADPDSTLVIYMGLATLPGLAAKLMNHGLSPDVPAAAVERGTTLQQRTVFGTLETLPELVKMAKLVSPTLIFIGKVVALSPLWPSNSCTEGRATRRHHPTPSAPAVGSRSAPRLVGEPRERLQRGPDPILPSQQ